MDPNTNAMLMHFLQALQQHSAVPPVQQPQPVAPQAPVMAPLPQKVMQPPVMNPIAVPAPPPQQPVAGPFGGRAMPQFGAGAVRPGGPMSSASHNPFLNMGDPFQQRFAGGFNPGIM